jgi:hypothetical protein
VVIFLKEKLALLKETVPFQSIKKRRWKHYVLQTTPILEHFG